MKTYWIKDLMLMGIYFIPEKKIKDGLFSSIYSAKLIVNGISITVKAKGNDKTLYEEGRIIELEHEEDYIKIQQFIKENYREEEYVLNELRRNKKLERNYGFVFLLVGILGLLLTITYWNKLDILLILFLIIFYIATSIWAVSKIRRY